MRIVRPIVVALLAAYVLGIALPDLGRVFGHPLYDFGYRTDDRGVVTDVAARSPAAKAGIQIGDRLNVLGTPPNARAVALIPGTVIRHEPVTIAFFRGDLRRVVTMSAELQEPVYRQPLVLARELAMLVFIIVGAMLVLLRPSPMTWGFYLFCCAFSPAPSAVLLTVTPFAVFVAEQIVSGLLFVAGVIGLDIFALRFPSGTPRKWRITAERVCLACIAPLAALSMWVAFQFLFYEPFTRVNLIASYITAAFVALAVVALVATYRGASGAERSRIQWLVFGSSVALVAFGVDAFFAARIPYWLYAALLAGTICMPLAVAYAVIRHRVIDVNFVISRALVYAVLTTFIVGIFALIDWLIGKVLEQTRVELAAEIAAALGLGFWLNGLHRRIDRFVDSVLFRQRYLAARRLARAAAGLPHAASIGAVDEMLVSEPADALKLASAAVFRRRDGAGFMREAALNWPARSARSLNSSEQLILHLRGEHGPLRLDDVHWPRTDLPHGDNEPVLAVPVLVRDRLMAIALYGSHVNGEALDPDEVASIDRLATGAATAYDHLEAEALRRELELLRARMRAQKTRR